MIRSRKAFFVPQCNSFISCSSPAPPFMFLHFAFMLRGKIMSISSRGSTISVCNRDMLKRAGNFPEHSGSPTCSTRRFTRAINRTRDFIIVSSYMHLRFWLQTNHSRVAKCNTGNTVSKFNSYRISMPIAIKRIYSRAVCRARGHFRSSMKRDIRSLQLGSS